MHTYTRFLWFGIGPALLLIFSTALGASIEPPQTQINLDTNDSRTPLDLPPDYSVDLYANTQLSNTGLVFNLLSAMGSDQSSRYGDSFSCANGGSLCFNNGVTRFGLDTPFHFTYRIDIPDDYQGYASNTMTPTHIVRVEILDPDTGNTVQDGSSGVMTHTQAFFADTGILTSTYQYGSDIDVTHGCIYDSFDGRHQCVVDTCEWEWLTDQEANDCLPIASSFTDQNDYAEINPYWFLSLDETIAPFATETETRYELYYYWTNPDSGLTEKKILATYYGQPEDDTSEYGMPDVGAYHASTDLQWVSPGAYNPIGAVPTLCDLAASPNGGFAPSGYVGCIETAANGPTADTSGKTMWGRGFEVNLLEDIPHIMRELETGRRSLYVDIRTMGGESENGYQLWAGPPHAHFGLSSDVNQRNLQLRDTPDAYTNEGVTVYAQNILSINNLVDQRFDYPLLYVGPESAGQLIELEIFDPDINVEYPFTFYFDTIDQSDFSISYTGADIDPDGVDRTADGSGRCIEHNNCNDEWLDPGFFVRVPQYTADCDELDPDPYICTPFTGGNLIVSFRGAPIETYQWYIRSISRTVDIEPTDIAPNILQINTSATTVNVGQAIQLTSTVEFDHDSDATSSTYRWALDGNVRTGESITYTFSTPGVYNVFLQVTDNDALIDTSGPLTITVTSIPSKPDLIIGNLQLMTPGSIALLQPVTFTVVVTNSSAITITEQFFIDLYFDPPAVNATGISASYSNAYQALDGLGVHQSQTITLHAPLGFSKNSITHTVYAMVDSVLQINESDETNNVTGPIEIITPPDLIIGELQIATTSPVTFSQPVTFTVQITNNSAIDITEPFLVDLYFDPPAGQVESTGISVTHSTISQAINRLDAGQSQTVTLHAPLGFSTDVATHTVYAMVDSNLQVVETNETNNLAGPIEIPHEAPPPAPLMYKHYLPAIIRSD